MDNTTEPTATPVVETTPVEAARPTISASFYTEPRSPIKTQAQYLEHSITARRTAVKNMKQFLVNLHQKIYFYKN